MDTSLKIARPGGAVGRVGVPQEEAIPAGIPSFFNNIEAGQMGRQRSIDIDPTRGANAKISATADAFAVLRLIFVVPCPP